MEKKTSMIVCGVLALGAIIMLALLLINWKKTKKEI